MDSIKTRIGNHGAVVVNPDGSNIGDVSNPLLTSNPSITITRNGSGYITNIAKLIGATTYNKVITRDGSNYITNISSWS